MLTDEDLAGIERRFDRVLARKEGRQEGTVGVVAMISAMDIPDLLSHIKVLTDELAAKTEVAKSNRRVTESYAQELDRYDAQAYEDIRAERDRVTRQLAEARQALDRQRERHERELAQMRVNWNAEARRFADEIDQLNAKLAAESPAAPSVNGEREVPDA